MEELLPRSSYTKEDDIRDFGLDKEFKETGVNFVAIDLETATFLRDSICEIGISIVENGEVKEEKSWLVKPPRNYYLPFNIEIHGIKPKDTENCPEFEDVWKEVEPYLTGKVVVAHNTAFDMYVLKDTFLERGMKFPSFVNFCTYRIGKRFINCYSYSLDNVCRELRIGMKVYHRAGSDATSCAKIFLECLERSGAKSYADLIDICNIRCGRFSDRYFRPQRNKIDYSKKKILDVNEIKGDPNKIDEDSYFYEKAVCFTGKCQYAQRKELLQMIADIGGIPMNTVTSETDILVVGQQDYRVVGESGISSKQKKAMKMKDKGMDIEIMSEAEFLGMFSE